jgi:hypothetical protein
MPGLVEQWLQSGQSQTEFAGQQEIKLATFAYWVKKHKHHHQPLNGYSKIELSDTPAAQRMTYLKMAVAVLPHFY